jgi:predicted Zn-dependent protease with MMP-like domain
MLDARAASVDYRSGICFMQAGAFYNRLSKDAGEELARVLASLPEDLREAAGKLPVICQLTPGRELLDEGELDEDLLGLFVGASYAEAVTGSNEQPPQIFLFLGNIWEYSDGDPRIYRRELRKTYLHELGHYLGLGEGELDARGMG